MSTKNDIEAVIGIDNVRLSADGRTVIILDQSLLPTAAEYLELEQPEEIYEAIKKLRVRGAPAIGIFAGYGIYVTARQINESSSEGFLTELRRMGEYLISSRPTAVNLSYAVKRMVKRAEALIAAEGDKVLEMSTKAKVLEALRDEAIAIHEEDIAMCRSISEYGLSLLKDGDGILTHCNAGPLATSRYGTGLGPILLGKERGMNFRVFSDETRPLLQGARLTAYELERAGVDVTLICDNMASIVMKNGWINACLVGCDRVAANGDTANKIGTSGVAILAKHYGIPFYVLGPTSTIDMSCKTGADIVIEERDPDEIKEMFYEKPMAPAEVKCYNPAFDVTDSALITAIITEKGIARPPYKKSLAAMFQK